MQEGVVTFVLYYIDLHLYLQLQLAVWERPEFADTDECLFQTGKSFVLIANTLWQTICNQILPTSVANSDIDVKLIMIHWLQSNS